MWWPFIQSLGGNDKMEVAGINVKTSEMDPLFVGFVDVFRCHRLFVSWKVHKTSGLPQLLFLATKIHRFNHWGCGDEWRNDVILLVAILANSYQKWTRRMVLVWGKNKQTPWHNNWYNCKVAKYYQRGTGVSFFLQAAVFSTIHIWQGGFSVNKATWKENKWLRCFHGPSWVPFLFWHSSGEKQFRHHGFYAIIIHDDQ